MSEQVRVLSLSADLPAVYGCLFDAEVRDTDISDTSVSPRRLINGGTSWRIEASNALSLAHAGGHATLALFRTDAITLPQPIALLERHRLGSQTFVPLREVRIIAVLALGQDTPDLNTLRAVCVHPGQGLTLAAGVWHHPLLALDAGDVLVLERTGPAPDCEVVTLPQPYSLQANAARI